jgi:hypothetical protein
MERIDKALKILKELLHGDRESLTPYGLDEEIGYCITHLKVFKEKDSKELMFSYFDEIDHIFDEQKRMIEIIKTICFEKYDQKEIGNIIDEVVFEFGKQYNDRIVRRVENE